MPVADIVSRAKGDINYSNGRVEKGTKQYMKFWSEHASYPFKSHDAWFVTEDIRWGKFEPTTDIKALVDKVNREDLWRSGGQDPRALLRPISRPRPRAARRPSSTARSSIRRTRPPISRAFPSSASK